MRNKPNFLIVGAAKCGTTSLFQYLREHPEVYMPGCKEVSYFCGREHVSTISFLEYLSYFSKAKKQKRIGEASVAYLYPKPVPQRIASCLGRKTKIIIILRNPVDMAYSLWNHNRRTEYEPLSFSDALKEENTRMRDKNFHDNSIVWPYNFAYTDRATYAPQVQRYLEVFGRDNVKIYIFEDFFSKIEDSLKDTYDFLGLDYKFDFNFHKKHNKSGSVYSKKLLRFHSETHILTKPIRKIIPTPMRRKLINLVNQINLKNTPRPPLSDEIKTNLKLYFRPSIKELEKLIDKDLTEAWK